MSANPERLIRLGVITSVHGIRGQVKIRSFTANPEDITAYGPLRSKSGSFYDITITGGASEVLIATVAGVTTRDEAEKLRSTDLFVPRSALPEPGEDEYYHEDLTGITAVTEDGKDYGQVLSISNFGAGDIAVMRLSSGDEEYLPLNKETFPLIDPKNRKIVVSPPEMIRQEQDQ